MNSMESGLSPLPRDGSNGGPSANRLVSGDALLARMAKRLRSPRGQWKAFGLFIAIVIGVTVQPLLRSTETPGPDVRLTLAPSNAWQPYVNAGATAKMESHGLQVLDMGYATANRTYVRFLKMEMPAGQPPNRNRALQGLKAGAAKAGKQVLSEQAFSLAALTGTQVRATSPAGENLSLLFFSGHAQYVITFDGPGPLAVDREPVRNYLARIQAAPDGAAP